MSLVPRLRNRLSRVLFKGGATTQLPIRQGLPSAMFADAWPFEAPAVAGSETWPALKDAMLTGDQLRTDVLEDDDAYILKMDLPGVDLEDIEVKRVGDALRVAAEREDEEVQEDMHHRHREIFHGRIVREFALPADAVSGSITASHDNGVLRVTIPKLEAAVADVDVIPVDRATAGT
eukprot:162648_1